MLNLTKLYFGTASESDHLRYGNGHLRSAAERRPVVVWTVTRTCNLKCVHCYTDSKAMRYPGELTTDEALGILEDLAIFRVPAILFSGGEPLLRPDLFKLAGRARDLGIRTTLSTNGTLITPAMAEKIRDAGFKYVGISLDGPKVLHDKFRGVPGAFKSTLEGIRNCIAVGQKVGLRLTLTLHTLPAIEDIFDIVEELKIPRVCFYHLAYAGRGRSLQSEDLTHAETRSAIDRIVERTGNILSRGQELEVLTVDNAVDGPYLYMKLQEENPLQAEHALALLQWNGGGRFSSGVGIANIDSEGNVHPDQFWRHYSVGNVRERKFSEIWSDPNEPLLKRLRDRLPYLKGRCHDCRFQSICGGALRVRAEAATGDVWASDPACYLTDQEIKEPALCPT